MAKQKKLIELRHYDLPPNEYILPLIGDTWKRLYQATPDHLHFHNLLEIGYCHFGDGDLYFDDGPSRHYTQGTLTIIPRSVPHTTNSSRTEINYWEYLFINLDALVSRAFPDNEALAHKLTARLNDYYLVSHEKDHPVLAEGILAILNEYKSGTREFQTEIALSRTLSFLLEAARVMPESISITEPAIKKKHDILESMEYIQQHFAEEIKIRDLADFTHTSETHFRRRFHEILHMTPVEYINFVRIQNACEQLASTRLSIHEIADKTGFATISSFNRCFKTILGIPPRQWRSVSENYKAKLLDYKISALKGWE